jgi:outer membrane protein assembly factor BamE
MRHFLISALLLSLFAGCSGGYIKSHRIDVQQGNALDQENVARLKPGLNRSQVRFLLGTPLVVDPFRSDRWDYVYVYYKAGKLAEQKRVSLFFDGDSLARIEGDLPVAGPAAEPRAPAPAPSPLQQPEPKAETSAVPLAADSGPKPAPLVPPAAPIPQTRARTEPVVASQAAPADVRPVEPAAAPVAKTAAAASQADRVAASTSSIVPPLPSPKNAAAYVDPRPSAEPSLRPETDVAQLKPDVIPPFPEPKPAAAAVGDDPVLKSLNTWVSAWAQRDEEAYIASYDASFVPQGGGNRADWEKRRRLLLGVAKNIEIKVDSPSVDRNEDGTATVTFNQFYRSDSYRDAVVKQVRMVERGGRWLIVDEKVLSILRGAQL